MKYNQICYFSRGPGVEQRVGCFFYGFNLYLVKGIFGMFYNYITYVAIKFDDFCGDMPGWIEAASAMKLLVLLDP